MLPKPSVKLLQPSLTLPDKYLWDFWLVQENSDYHLFYLQSPRSICLFDPEKRHWNVSIGHAITQDFQHWERLPDALSPGLSGGHEERSTWTGSIIRHDNLWYLFYTSTHKEENGCIQRISLATSTDLIHWKKYPKNPLFEADDRYYEKLDFDLWCDRAWRDPWVFKHPETGEFHAFITARANYGPSNCRGVIAHATSQNLIDWQVQPPLTEPGYFSNMECPHLTKIGNRYYLLFSVPPGQVVGTKMTGTCYMVADNPLGPFSPPKNFMANPYEQLFAGKLMQGPDEQWYCLTWRNLNPDGSFIGDLAEPLPIMVDYKGDLEVKSPRNFSELKLVA
ncbi:MAG: glycosyl hydrolase family 32 [Symploca sp. SIO1B1]|nr:glycosyl hydrolase family 32 [Symploca sp. SIO2D2]NER19998.1 glycosyl hydrolase family 32 [Symploca sp. SIO1C2]NER92529.1 glycosyl hydrolase family 32 [Symploca sp. SIO1B1]